MRSKRRDPWAVKFGFTDKEWATFQGRLTHAEKAIAMLMERAPEAFERAYGRDAIDPQTSELSAEARSWIHCIVADLLIAQRGRPTRQAKADTVKRAVLKVVGGRKR